MSPTQFEQEFMAEYHKMEGLIYEEFSRDLHMKPCPFSPVRWALSIDFGYNHPLAAGIFAIGSDDSVHLDRMIYKRKLGDEQRMQAIKDLIGDTRLDIQVGDSQDPLAIDTLNRQLSLRIQRVVKGKGAVLEGVNQCKLHQVRLTMDTTCEDLAWRKRTIAGSWIRKTNRSMSLSRPMTTHVTRSVTRSWPSS